MNRNGSAIAIVSIIFGIILILGIIITIIVLVQKNVFDRDKNKDLETLDLFLLTRTQQTLASTPANYEVHYTGDEGNDVLYSSGKTSGKIDQNGTAVFTEVKVPKGRQIEVRCWSDDHYLVRTYPLFNAMELLNNKSSHGCDMYKMGKLKVELKGDITSDYDIITANVSSDYSFLKTSICVGWTGGIQDVSLSNQMKDCEVGAWKNYSEYDVETKKYTWLPNSTYLCGNKDSGETELCELVEGDKCKLRNEEIPFMYRKVADSCFYTGSSIQSDSKEFQFIIKSYDFKNVLDEINIYFYDKERVYDPSSGLLVWSSENNGGDIGAENVNVTISIKD